MQLSAGQLTTELPIDLRGCGVALSFQGCHFPGQFLLAFNPARQANPLEHPNLDFGLIKPTAVLGSVVLLDFVQYAPGFGWGKSLVQTGGSVGINQWCYLVIE